MVDINLLFISFTASGQVLDAQKEPLIGVSVQEKGTTNGAITDLDGNFTLTVRSNATLIFSYVGYKSQEQKASRQMKVTLQEDNEVLEEVVVIGYGSVKRKDVTTAISTVSTKDLDVRPIVSAGQAIQGKAAGISVIQPSGTPGGEMSIRVRGTTSMNGSNDPLYVVDGVPVDNIKFLSPNDIESMQILKDASSASIYGSRAANGVILITTKAGATGKAKVSLTAQFGLNKVADKVESLNAAQYKELQDEIGLVSLPDGLPDRTDWFDETYKTGKMQNYQVAVSNGNEKMKYYLSAGYLDEKGILDISYYKRYNFRVNLENQIRSWLTVSANISYSDYTSNGGGAMGTGANRGGVVLAVINTPTYAPIWDALNPNQYYNNFYGVGNITNPLENMARAKNNKDKENRLLASGNVLLTLLPELKFKSTLTLDRRNAVNTTFLDPISTAWGRNQYGEASDNRNMNTVLTFDNVFTYNKNFKRHGKIRGGWGQTGNQSGIGDYAYLQRYNIGRIEWFKVAAEGDTTDYANAVPTISQANLRTSDLTWETTTQTNIGLDLTVLNGRLTFNMDYYYKKTKNMLMNVSLPAGAAAATSIARNEGEMTNKGFELTISSKNFRGGAFTWDTDFNISFNRNKLTKLELQKVYYDAKTADVVNDYVVRNEPGRALGGFYGYISDGVDPETGELMYRDLSGDGKISTSDRTYIGDPNPDFTYGLTNTFSWKGFNLSVFIQGSYGNDIFNASRIETEGMYDGKNQSTKVLNRWKIPGQITNVPKANFKLLNSTYFIEDGSYLRLKDVSLSYNFKGKLLQKWGITRLQPYFTATNLLTWTSYSGMDPEVNQWGNSGTVQGIDWGTYPHSRSYVFGINVEF